MGNLEDTLVESEKEQINASLQNKKPKRLDRFVYKYQNFVQTHRNIAFLKNMVLSGVAFMGGGYFGAKLMRYGTDSKTLITASSLLSQYIVGFAAFLPLHAFDNYDVYHEEGKKYKYKELAKDTVKLVLGLGILDAAYIVGRPILHYNLMKRGVNPEIASLYADAICIPSYWALSVPVAKLFGVIKKNKQK